jgi:hypothetical protein
MNPIKASSQHPISIPTKKTLLFSSGTPIKGNSQLPSNDDLFWTPTPEKPVQPPRRGRGVRVAFSMNDVRQAALGLRKKGRGIDGRLHRDPALVNKQLPSDKAVKLSPSNAEDEIELPHK